MKKSRIPTLLLSIVMLLSLAACGQESKSASGPSGEYSTSAKGFGGDVNVTVTLENGVIVAVTAEGPSETAGVGSNAIDQLPDAIVAAGNADVDGVSGATMTSNAIKTAVKKALNEARGTEQEAFDGYTEGTYTGTAQGNNGPLKVEVTVSKDKIESVEVVSNNETALLSVPALERIPSEIVEHQTLTLDAVSGATVTSNAIIAATKNAVLQAGGNMAYLDANAYAPEAGDPIEKDAEVVVVGAGGAGLSAAVTALQNGASVILIEKNATLGGNTLQSGCGWCSVNPEVQGKVETKAGQIETLQSYLELKPADYPAVADVLEVLQGQIRDYLAGDTTYMFDSVELFIFQTYIMGTRTGLDGTTITGNVDLIKTMCTQSEDARQWIYSFDIDEFRNYNTPIGGPWHRSREPQKNETGKNGLPMLQALETYLLNNGAEIMYETRATDLITKKGAVTGVLAKKTDSTPVTLHAKKAVILCTGGYGANSEMVFKHNNYWKDLPDDLLTTNCKTSTGDGITMAEKIGAQLTGMGFVQLMPTSSPVTGDTFKSMIEPYDFIFVDPTGNRFINEMAEGRDTLSAAALSVGSYFYVIMDQQMIDNGNYDQSWYDAKVDAGILVKADTLEELAEKIDVDYNALQKTLNNYNAAVKSGVDSLGKTEMVHTCEVGPFYACPRRPAIHYTMGGITINSNAQVLDTDGNVIKGLYAAGETTGGIHAGNRCGGNAVADIFVFGRIAGKNAASLKK